ncbi:MAG: hypothetical protein LC802_09955 [Acidobacteria bacterium]|nr:hypothetical protein [Acidobacteriota bacterium]
MKRLFTLLLTLSLLGGAGGAGAGQQQQQQQARGTGAGASTETLIRNATILTVMRGRLENSDLLVRNGKIAAVGQNLKAGTNARIIDGTGKFILPGIIDAHSHSMMDGSVNECTQSVTSMEHNR